MRVLPKSPFDYITLCFLVFELRPYDATGQQSLCFESPVRQVQLCSALLTACGRAGAEGSGGNPGGRRIG